MSLIGKNESKPKILAPTGLQKAWCIQILDLGTQTNSFKGKEYLDHQIRFTFELTEKKHVFDEKKGAQPFCVSPFAFSSNLGVKKTAKFFEGWIGRQFTDEERKNGFNFSSLIRKAGQINIMHSKKKSDPSKLYEDITGIFPMTEGMTFAKPINPLVCYSIGAENQWEEFAKISSYWQDVIKKSPEWQSEAIKHNYQSPTSEGAEAVADEPEDETIAF